MGETESVQVHRKLPLLIATFFRLTRRWYSPLSCWVGLLSGYYLNKTYKMICFHDAPLTTAPPPQATQTLQETEWGNRKRSGAWHQTGTMQFMAIEVLFAAVADAPSGPDLRRNTRRALACYHSDTYDQMEFIKDDEVYE